MKNWLFGICCLFTGSLWGQVVYAPVFINPCSGEEELVTWFLSDSSKEDYSAEEEDFRKITLPHAGTYQLYYNYPKPPISITVPQQDIYRDTLLLEQLQLVRKSGLPPVFEYYDCDSLADGLVVTYYYNKNKRVVGSFDKGQPIDSTFYYYRNGQLKRLLVASEKIGIRIDFYENGQKKLFYDFDNGVLKDYYSDGQLESSSILSKRGFPTLTKYYPNGQLKSKSNDESCKRYDRKGVVREKITSKTTKAKNANYPLYQYYWSSYDSTKTLTRVVEFEAKRLPFLPLPHHLKQVDPEYLKEIILYKKGNPTYKIRFLYISEPHQDFKQKLFLHKIEGKKWIQQQTAPAEEVYQLLEKLEQEG